MMNRLEISKTLPASQGAGELPVKPFAFAGGILNVFPAPCDAGASGASGRREAWNGERRLRVVRPPTPSAPLNRVLILIGGWALVAVGLLLVPLPGPGWLVVGIGLLLLSREVRWARGAVVRLERFMRRHGLRTSLRRLIIRRRRSERRPPEKPMAST
jgi:uncharacterized protein (TIGR02611 family)